MRPEGEGMPKVEYFCLEGGEESVEAESLVDDGIFGDDSFVIPAEEFGAVVVWHAVVDFLTIDEGGCTLEELRSSKAFEAAVAVFRFLRWSAVLF